MCVDDQVTKVSRIIATTAKDHEFRPQYFKKHLRHTKDTAEFVNGVSKLIAPEALLSEESLRIYCQARFCSLTNTCIIIKCLSPQRVILSLTIVTSQSTKGRRAHLGARETRMPENHWGRSDPLHHERQFQPAWKSVRPTTVGGSSS